MSCRPIPARPDAEKVSFNQVNKNTGHCIKHKKVDAETSIEVENDEIIKGYPVDRASYIEISKDELESIALKSTRMVGIDEFVPKADTIRSLSSGVAT